MVVEADAAGFDLLARHSHTACAAGSVVLIFGGMTPAGASAELQQSLLQWVSLCSLELSPVLRLHTVGGERRPL